MNSRGLLVALAWLLTAAPAAAAPGAAYVFAEGVVKIDDEGKVATVLPPRLLPNLMTVTSDGEVWVASTDEKIYKGRPSRSLKLPSQELCCTPAAALTPASRDGIWALGRQALFRIDSRLQIKASIKLPVERLLGSASLLEVEGVVWMASDYGLFRLTGETWARLSREPHRHLARDSTGVIWTARSQKDAPQLLIAITGTRAAGLPIEGSGVAALAAGQEGRLYVMVWGQGWRESRIDVLTSSAAGSRWTTRRFGGMDGLNHLAVDDRERVWSSQQHGLVVFSKEGRRLVHLPQGSVAGLGRLSELRVAGRGPAQLPSGGSLPRGSVRGRIMKSRTEPLASTSFEVCAGNCFDGATKFLIKTGPDGRFETRDVAAIEYWSVLDTRGERRVVHAIGNFISADGDRRSTVRRLRCCATLPPGGTLELGNLLAPAPH